LEALKSAITDKTILVSIMYVNNEVGTIQPIKDIANLLKEKDTIFHTDAVQAYGLLEMNMEELPIDLVSISAHKINGPKGIGCLYVRSGVKISSLSYGGEQERKRRAGTENVASIAAFKRAVEITQQKREERFAMYHQYRKKMLEIFTANGINFIENGQADNVLPNILNVSFLDVQAEAMLMNLDLAGISASSGSACTAGAIEPSHVIVSMYGEEHECLEHAIRFSFGYNNTMKQIEYVANTASEIVKRIIK
jgi:cysteine desulfurase